MSEELKDPPSGETESDSEQDWGDDWESAFQAEEELFGGEIGEQLQADDLDESWDEVLAVSSGVEDTTTSNDVKQPSPSADSQDITPDSEQSQPGFLAGVYARFFALPLYLRLASSILPATLLILALIPFFSVTEQGPDILLPKEQPVTEKKSSLPAAPEKVRSKWPLTSFFIPINSEKETSTIFLNLDLTMILLLDEGQELPSANVSRARDLVYQFYTNRPLYELRRFSLARGEMNKKLRSWIRKQWPEVNLETIVFDHYELI